MACGNLGRLQESEDHFRRAYEVAAADGDKGEMGQILGSLADIQRKRGKLVEANEACLKTASMDPKAIRMALAVQCQILREWGRFDEALEMLRRHDQATNIVIPALERRVRATRALDMSRIEAECGRADDAWAHIQQAISELGNDAKLGLKCDAAAAWVLSARGHAEESRRVTGQVEDRLIAFEHDPSTCRGVLYDLGMAACTRGDHEKGGRLLEPLSRAESRPGPLPDGPVLPGRVLSTPGQRVERRIRLPRSSRDEYRYPLRPACPPPAWWIITFLKSIESNPSPRVIHHGRTQ